MKNPNPSLQELGVYAQFPKSDPKARFETKTGRLPSKTSASHHVLTTQIEVESVLRK